MRIQERHLVAWRSMSAVRTILEVSKWRRRHNNSRGLFSQWLTHIVVLLGASKA